MHVVEHATEQRRLPGGDLGATHAVLVAALEFGHELPERATQALVGLARQRAALAFERSRALARERFERRQLRAFAPERVAFGDGFGPDVRQFRKRAVVVAFARREKFLGTSHDRGVETERPCEWKRERPAGRAEIEFVGGHEGRGIEAHAAVAHVRRGRREELQFRTMRGDDPARAVRQEVFDERDAERGARPRLGSARDLVDEHERTFARRLHDRPQAPQVRGKGRGVLRDRLLVADIAAHVREISDRGPLSGGELHAAVRHRHEESDQLQRDRLAAHVRPADHDEAYLVVEHERLRHGTRAEQRVAAGANIDARRIHDRRRQRVHRLRDPNAREHEIEIGQHVEVGFRALAPRTDERRQVGEDARDLVLLLDTQRAQAVVDVERVERFDEQRVPGRRRIVHHARDRVAELRLHGNHEAPVADGHDRILDRLRVAWRAQDRRAAVARLVLRVPGVAAQARERRARAVEHVAALADRAIDRGRNLR